MSSIDPRFGDFLLRLHGRVNDEAVEAAGVGDSAPGAGFRENVFTEVVLGRLEDLGQVGDTQVCYFDQSTSRGTAKVNAWGYDEDEGQATLVTTIFRGTREPELIPKADLEQSIKRALRVYSAASQQMHSKMEPSSDAFDMMERLHQVQGMVGRLRVIVLTDGFANEAGRAWRESSPLNVPWRGPEVQLDVWDIRRLFRVDASGLPYEPIEIDLLQRLRAPLPCIASPGVDAGFDVYLAILPGELIYELYHQYGPRLLELNVRSFLQARGKVNRGIRDTLKDEPASFIAYNNGLSATAERVETTNGTSGLGLTKLYGLQVVNGGQTVASIHRAKQRDRIDISNVFVQAKLTVVGPKQVETLVPLISRYANTQNRVDEADFSANHPFHVKLQQLSESVWTPGERSRWFYERARGQYQVAQQRDGTTVAQLARFKQANPPSQRFDKVSLAKYAGAWDQHPHLVSRGGQKNFVAFMQGLAKEHRGGWEPDAAWFRDVIAKAIIFKEAERAARFHKLPAYRANAIAYTVALVSSKSLRRVDLQRIWGAQSVSTALAETLAGWMPAVYEALIASSDGRNVTEWCKKSECWDRIRGLELTIPPALAAELCAP
jgi:hypothetical protein